MSSYVSTLRDITNILQMNASKSISTSSFWGSPVSAMFTPSSQPDEMAQLLSQVTSMHKKKLITNEEKLSLKQSIFADDWERVKQVINSKGVTPTSNFGGNDISKQLQAVGNLSRGGFITTEEKSKFKEEILKKNPTMKNAFETSQGDLQILCQNWRGVFSGQQTGSRSSLKEMLLLVGSMSRQNMITTEEKRVIKQEVLRKNPKLIDACHSHSELNDLCGEFKAACGLSSGGTDGARGNTSRLLLEVNNRFRRGEITLQEKTKLKDHIIRSEGFVDVDQFLAEERAFGISGDDSLFFGGGSANEVNPHSFTLPPLDSFSPPTELSPVSTTDPFDQSAFLSCFKKDSGGIELLLKASGIVDNDLSSIPGNKLPANAFSFPVIPYLPTILSDIEWGYIENGSILHANEPSVSKINTPRSVAAFDFDDTLVKTKTGRTFATSHNDWVLLYDQVTNKLREFHSKGYKIVIFSNQLGIGKMKMPEKTVTARIEDFMKEVGVPIEVYCAITDDVNRKPAIGMWDSLSRRGGVKKEGSFYVGDAAGRKGDFSCSDRKFASNVGLTFYTPEEFFLGASPQPFTMGGIDLRTHSNVTECDGLRLELGQQEMIIFVGFPGSGKSSFYRRNYGSNSKYVHINRDTLLTKAKCLKAVKEALQTGKSVVVDNTNPSASARAEYISLARSAACPVRCFHFVADKEFAKHLNIFRCKKDGQKKVPDIAYNIYQKQFEKPSTMEGFTEVKEIKFVPNFQSANDEALFSQLT